jgi:hypothetical protein
MIEKIKQHLTRYLSDESSLDQFEDWFLPATWNLKPDEGRLAYELAGQVSLAIAEHDNGHITLEELRDRFAALLSGVEAKSRG